KSMKAGSPFTAVEEPVTGMWAPARICMRTVGTGGGTWTVDGSGPFAVFTTALKLGAGKPGLPWRAAVKIVLAGACAVGDGHVGRHRERGGVAGRCLGDRAERGGVGGRLHDGLDARGPAVVDAGAHQSDHGDHAETENDRDVSAFSGAEGRQAVAQPAPWP